MHLAMFNLNLVRTDTENEIGFQKTLESNLLDFWLIFELKGSLFCTIYTDLAFRKLF